ncbi:MAG: hypothetical protein AAF724_13055 [Pseudomonadota bacterium]
MTKEEMLENSVIVAAHPDDELLWFGAILQDVDRVILVYEDFWANPQIGKARAAVLDTYPRDRITSLRIPEAGTHSCANWDDPTLNEYGIEFGPEARRRDLKQRVKRVFGKSQAPQGGINHHYEQNFNRIYSALEGILEPDMNVITHNPWGEYGHEDHIQVYRVVEKLRTEIGFKQWMSNYCTDRSLPLAMRYFDGEETDTIQLPVDKDFADRVADVYRQEGCWTWADDWKWFPYEFYRKAPVGRSSAANHAQPMPLNMFRFSA